MKEQNTIPGVVPLPPDGGWGWMVLIGAFISYFLADGWSYSFGVLFPSLLDVYGEGKGKTSLIAALLYGVPLLLSPIVCALTSCYGCRIVAIIGGVLTALSMILTAFAQSIDQMCVTIGLLGSLGLSMAYLPALIIVTFYFEKRRGLATGLAVAGSGLGSICFPLMMNHLLEIYHWRGFLLITGALCLHIVVAGCLFRPPPMGIPRDDEHDISDIDSVGSTCSVKPIKHKSKFDNVILLPRLHRKESKSIQSCNELDGPWGTSRNRFVNGSDLSLRMHGRCTGALVVDLKMYSDQPKATSMPDICMLENDPTMQKPTAIVQDQPDIQTKSGTRLQEFCFELKMIFHSMLDKSLLKNWAYLLFCGANFILYLWIGVPYIFLIDRAMELNIPGDIYFLASIIGIGRTVGQIIVGFLGDVPQINCNVLYAVSVLLIGVDTLFVPLCSSYVSLCVYAGIYGFFVSATYAIQMMCVVDIVGLDKTTSAFGLLQLLQGIATILGTPLAGWLYDVTSAYDPTFYSSGAWMVFSGLLLLPVSRLINLSDE